MQQSNSLEVEVKIAVANLDSVAARLSELGFEATSQRKFESNTIWDTTDLSLRASGEIVRLREYGLQRVVTYKGPDPPGKHKQREELESGLTSLATLERIFARLGLVPSFRYEKYRTEYTRNGSQGVVTLDETPIGNFIELEGEPSWIDATAHELGFPESQYLTSSYAALYANHCLAVGVPIEHMIFTKPLIS